MDTTQRTESLKDLVAQIAEGRVLLPEFQRDFVWDETKTHDLVDSLIRDIFIGSLIYGIPSFEITVRGLDSRPRKGPGSRAPLPIHSFTKDQVNTKVKTGEFRLLLDGQQRATSIYRAVKGIDPVWVIFKRLDELPDHLKGKWTAATLEEALHEVSGSQSDERLSIRLEDVYDIMEGKIKRERDKAELLASSAYAVKQGLTDLEQLQKNELFEQYLHFSDRLQDLFKAEKLLSYYMLDTNEEKFSLFFERSNSKGIQLSFIDILAAKLYAGFNLRKSVDTFRGENPDYSLNRESIVRAIAFIVSDGKQIDRAYILSNLSADHFNQYWDKLCKCFRQSFDYLDENYFLLSQEWMPYENMAIPLMILLHSLKRPDFSQLDALQTKIIKYWYWASILSQRYSGSSNEVIIGDCKMMQSLVAKDYERVKQHFVAGRFQLQVTTSEDLSYISKKGNALYRGILNLVHFSAKGLTDWKNGDKLSFNSRLEDHHIYPRAYLKNQDERYEDSQMDCVLNRTLVPKITNIKIGARRPSEYLSELKEGNKDLDAALASHLVTNKLMSGELDTQYENFQADRAEKIMKIIQSEVVDVWTAIGAEIK